MQLQKRQAIGCRPERLEQVEEKVSILIAKGKTEEGAYNGQNISFPDEEKTQCSPAITTRQQQTNLRCTAFDVKAEEQADKKQCGHDQKEAKRQEQQAEVRAAGTSGHAFLTQILKSEAT